jgi:hypothetical protein
MITGVILNWKRPANVERIVKGWLTLGGAQDEIHQLLVRRINRVPIYLQKDQPCFEADSFVSINKRVIQNNMKQIGSCHFNKIGVRILTAEHGLGPNILLRHANDQLANLLLSARTTVFARFGTVLLGSFLFPNPTQESVGSNNRHQGTHGFAQPGTKLQQLLPLLWGDSDSHRQLTAQHFILDLKIPNLAGRILP